MTGKFQEQSTARRLTALFIMLYITVISLACGLKYQSFQYADFDLAVHTQSLHNLLNGSLDCSILGIPFPGNHMAVSLLLIAPFYFLFPSPATILIFQTVVLAAGAIAVFSYSRRHLQSPLPMIMAALYLLYPPLIYMNLYEFHPVALASTFLLFAMLAYDRRAPRSYALYLILAMACQENIALIVIMMGIKALFDKRPAAWCIAPVLAGTAWFALCIFWIMPAFNPGIMRFDSMFGEMGNSLPEIAKHMILNPVSTCRTMLTLPNMLYLLSLLLPLALTSLLAPLYLLPVLPVLAQRLLSARGSETTILYHYQAELIPFIFIASIHGLKLIGKLKAKRAQIMAITAMIAMTLFSFVISSLPETFFNIKQQAEESLIINQSRNRALKNISPADSVTSTFRYLPRLANRKELHSLHHIYTGYYTLSDIRYPVPDNLNAVLLDKDDPLTFGAGGFFTPGGHTNVEHLLRINNMDILFADDPLFLFMRKDSKEPDRQIDGKPAALLPGMTRQQKNIFLTENHCNALIAWHVTGVTNAVLVHLDTHDDFRAINAENLKRLTKLLDEKSYQQVFLNSDTSSFINLKKRNSDLLYDLGNFIYPALKLGMLSSVYWVVPDRIITPVQNARLKEMINQNLPASHFEDLPEGGFSALIDGVPLTVLTLDTLPGITKPVLLDIDIDFFAFREAMTVTHLIGELSHNPEQVLAILDSKTPSRTVITISASVWGGYLPLMNRFLADAVFDYYSKGAYPEDARLLAKAVHDFKEGLTPVLSSPANNPDYFAARQHLNALLSLSAEDPGGAANAMRAAAADNPVYLKGFLDMAEALLAMQRPSDALNMISIFKSLNSGESYNSLAIKAMALMDKGDLSKALASSSQLVDWERNAYTLLIHGSALSKAGRTADAAACFNTLIELQPDHSTAHYNLGIIEEANGNSQKAIHHYRKALEYGGPFWQAYENLGFLMLKQNEFASAEKLIKTALKINPCSTASANNLATAMAHQGKMDEATSLLKSALSVNPDNHTLKLNLAEILFLKGNKKEAQELCSSILKTGNHPAAEALLQRITSSLPAQP